MDFKFKVIKNVIAPDIADLLASSLLIEEEQGKLSVDGAQVVGASIVHGNGIMESLLLKLLPLMIESTGVPLLPTYSFARIYRRGDALKRHTDRPSCEYSTTLTLGYISDGIWPIMVKDSGETIVVPLDKCDMMIYKGCDIEHWREPLTGGLWIQVFLHYVNSEGPHKEYAFDKRDVGPLYETIYSEILMGGSR